MRPGLTRAIVALYLLFLILLPWSKFPPFPWLHENAQWSDVVFAVVAILWILECSRKHAWPRFGALNLAMGLYLLAATLSLLLAAPDLKAGAMKLLGMSELAAIALVTSDLAWRESVHRGISRAVAITSLAVTVAAVSGVTLFYAGVWTPLVGTYGDHLIGSRWYVRAHGAFSHPNLLASFCIFAAGVVLREDAGLSRMIRTVVLVSLWLAVFSTFSHGILAFMLAASIRRARTPGTRRFVAGIATLFLLAIVSLTFLNWSINLANPASSRVRWGVSSGREQTVRSALGTLVANPVWGCGPGASPGWFRGRPYDAHLTPLNIAATMGLPALAAFVWLFVILWRNRKRPTDLSIWGAFAGFALDSLVSDVEDFRHLWVMIGLAHGGTTDRARNIG